MAPWRACKHVEKWQVNRHSDWGDEKRGFRKAAHGTPDVGLQNPLGYIIPNMYASMCVNMPHRAWVIGVEIAKFDINFDRTTPEF